jgi:hypothetical protein
MDIAQALQTLTPGAEWVLNGDDWDGLTWLSDDVKKPTKKSVEAEIKRLKKEYDDTEYQRLRQPEYPPIEQYLDGVVKGDQAQIDAYIAACLEVKSKFPKP